MKLPVNKRKELEKKGKRESEPTEGGGALGRLRQFEEERGLEKTDIAEHSDEVSGGEEAGEEQGRDKER